MDSYIGHDKFALVSNALKRYEGTKEEVKKSKDPSRLSKILIYILKKNYRIVWSIEKYRQIKVRGL